MLFSSSLGKVSFRSLSMLIQLIKNLCLGSLISGLPQEYFLLIVLFSVNGHTFLFLCMPHNFFIENWTF